MRSVAIRTANNFLEGCDPEFVVLAPDGKLIHADYERADGAIGWDHGRRVFELRPRPSRSSYRLVERLQELILDPKLDKYRDYKWRAGGVYKPPNGEAPPITLGGHVHLGIMYGTRGLWPDSIPRALDRATSSLLHLDILPVEESTARQIESKGRYGMRGDLRLSDYPSASNGLYHLEYRTPASWLYKPEAAYIILTVYKLAAVQQKFPAWTGDVTGLQEFLRGFRHKDDDVDRLFDNFNESRWPRVFQGDSDCDFKQNWRQLEF